jgi:hypothetical protein
MKYLITLMSMLTLVFVAGAAKAEENLLRDPTFQTLTTQKADWFTQEHGNAKMTATAADGKVTLNATVKGTESWNLQLLQNDLTFKKDTTYVLTFTATGKLEGVLETLAMQNGEPWAWYGDLAGFEVSDKPKVFTYKFKPNTDTTNGRITFQLGQATGTVTISDVKLIAE